MSAGALTTLIVLLVLAIPPAVAIILYKLRQQEFKVPANPAEIENGRINRKLQSADVDKKRGLFLRGALVVSLASMLVAFTFTPPDKRDLGEYAGNYSEEIEMEPPPTVQPPPPEPPPPPPPEIEIIEDEDEPEEEPDIKFEEPDDLEPLPELPTPPPVEPEPEVTKPLRFVEQMPKFPGGDDALRKYVQERVKYPSMARENGIEGTVYVEFVVKADGHIGEVKILRPIGGGCDEEVVKVIRNLPKWEPGRQTGRPVPVWFNMPVVFKMTQ